MGKAGERRLVQLASKQFGVVRAQDLVACQVSRGLLGGRIETGEWSRLHRGVFKLGTTQPNLDELEMAAVLAAGRRAVLSHTSAARRLGLDVPPEALVQITIPASRQITKLPGVQVWHSRDMFETDVTKRGPFRLTHLARTMVDLASVLDDAWLRATLDSALRQRKTNLAWIFRALRDHGNGRRGASRLRALIGEYRREDEVPDSVLESLWLELGRAAGRKPKLHWNVLEGERLIAEVDFAWPEVRLCVEVDGWMQHGTRSASVRDRARDRALLGLGWMVLRYTWQDVTGNRESVIRELVSTYHSRALSL
jgi:very-short-patch-repair endonuclease